MFYLNGPLSIIQDQKTTPIPFGWRSFTPILSTLSVIIGSIFPNKHPLLWENVRIARILHHQWRSIGVKSNFSEYYILDESVFQILSFSTMQYKNSWFWCVLLENSSLPPRLVFRLQVPLLVPNISFSKVRCWRLQKFKLYLIDPVEAMLKQNTKNEEDCCCTKYVRALSIRVFLKKN